MILHEEGVAKVAEQWGLYLREERETCHLHSPIGTLFESEVGWQCLAYLRALCAIIAGAERVEIQDAHDAHMTGEVMRTYAAELVTDAERLRAVRLRA